MNTKKLATLSTLAGGVLLILALFRGRITQLLLIAYLGEVIRCCQEKSITDGSCGMRELIAWVQSFMIEHDILAAARYTVLSGVSSDPENREEILSSCLLPLFNP